MCLFLFSSETVWYRVSFENSSGGMNVRVQGFCLYVDRVMNWQLDGWMDGWMMSLGPHQSAKYTVGTSFLSAEGTRPPHHNTKSLHPDFVSVDCKHDLP